MFHTFAGIVGAMVALLICGFAIWRGGAAERWAGAAILTGWMATPLVQVSQTQNPEWGMFWVDVALLLLFCAMIWIYRRPWLAVLTAIQLLLVTTHWAMLIDHRVTMGTYIIVMGFWSLASLAALLMSTLGALARRRSAAHDPGTAPG